MDKYEKEQERILTLLLLNASLLGLCRWHEFYKKRRLRKERDILFSRFIRISALALMFRGVKIP